MTGQVTDAVRVIGAFAYIDAEVTQGDEVIPTGSRILGVAKRSGSLLGVYEFQDGAPARLGRGRGVHLRR